MGRFGFGIIAILAFIALLTGLCELLFHRALKMHPAMRDLLAKMAQARRRDFSFASRYRLRRKPSASRRSLLRKPCRNAMPSGREKLAISFLRSGSRGTQRGNTMALGYNATRRRWPSSGRTASPTSVCIPFFTAVNRPFSLSAIG